MDVKFLCKDKLIADMHLDRVPVRGEVVRLFSYNQADYSEIHLKEFMVSNVVTVLRDPNPPKGYRSANIGTNHYIVMLLDPEEIKNAQELVNKDD